MKYNHEKAQKIVSDVEAEKLKSVKDKIISVIQKDDCTVSDYALSIGRKLGAMKLEGEDLKKAVITITEPLYEVITTYGVEDEPNKLFATVLSDILYELRDKQFNSIIGDMEDIYEDYI